MAIWISIIKALFMHVSLIPRAMQCTAMRMLFLVSGYTATTFLSYTPYRICSPWMNQSQIVAQRFLKHQPRFTASHRADYGLYGDPSAA